jgi:DNA processing protein
MAAYNSDHVYWIWLSQINGIGPVIAKILLSVFKTPQNIYKASKNEFLDIRGIGNITADIIFNAKSLIKAEEILNECKKLNIGILTYADSLYPIPVKDIKKSPIVLFYRGNIIEDSMGIAIVGSRRCTEYGKRLTVEVAEFLAQNHIPVISGIEKGALISEYPPGTKPDAKHFPMRNRLISAWCRKLLVVEAGENLTSLESVILTQIKDNPMTLDKLLFILKEDKSDILEVMSIMELEGKIINNRGVVRISF